MFVFYVIVIFIVYAIVTRREFGHSYGIDLFCALTKIGGATLNFGSRPNGLVKEVV